MFTTLQRAKQHLNIDGDYIEDDELILAYISASEDAVEKILNCKLSSMVDREGYLPFSVQSAILLLIGNLYQNREPISIGTAIKIPYTFEFLINLNKNYKTKF